MIELAARLLSWPILSHGGSASFALPLDPSVVCPEVLHTVRFKKITVVTKSGFYFCVHAPTGEVAKVWETFQVKEKRLFSAFDRYVTRSSVVLDIGAWVGQTPLYLAKLAKTVVALEPSSQAYALLMDNIALNPDVGKRIVGLQAALGNFDGQALFTDTGNSMDRPVVVVRVDGQVALSRLLALFPNLGGNVLVPSCQLNETGLVDFVRDFVLHRNPGEDHLDMIALPDLGAYILIVDPRIDLCTEFMRAFTSGQLDPQLRRQIRALQFPHAAQGVSGTFGVSEVEVISVGTLVRMHPELAQTDFVKIDVEGAEKELVRELRDLLLVAHPIMVIALHEVFIGRAAVEEVFRQLASIFPYLMELDGRTPFDYTRPRPTADILCLWALP